MAQLYSERLMQEIGAGAWDWFVPAGYRAIVRCINAVNTEGNPGQVLVYGPSAYLYYKSLPGSAAIEPVDLRVVLYAGDRLALQHIGGTISTTISGYVFADDSGRRGPPEGRLDHDVEPLPSVMVLET